MDPSRQTQEEYQRQQQQYQYQLYQQQQRQMQASASYLHGGPDFANPNAASPAPSQPLSSAPPASAFPAAGSHYVPADPSLASLPSDTHSLRPHMTDLESPTDQRKHFQQNLQPTLKQVIAEEQHTLAAAAPTHARPSYSLSPQPASLSLSLTSTQLLVMSGAARNPPASSFSPASPAAAPVTVASLSKVIGDAETESAEVEAEIKMISESAADKPTARQQKRLKELSEERQQLQTKQQQAEQALLELLSQRKGATAAVPPTVSAPAAAAPAYPTSASPLVPPSHYPAAASFPLSPASDREKLQILSAMGWTNETENRFLLLQHGGNLQAVAQELLSRQPAASAAAASSHASFVATQTELLRQLGELNQRLAEKKRRSIVLSDIDSAGWEAMSDTAKGGLTLKPVPWAATLTDQLLASSPTAASPPAFEWTDNLAEPNHKDKYLKYLQTHLMLGCESATLYALDNDREFLNVRGNSRLPFDLRGTSDVAVVLQEYLSARCPQQGLLAVIELKKEVSQKAARQSIGQLLAADVVSNFRPVAVLTDLRDEWHFYWLEGRTVVHMRPPQAHARRDAFLFLRLALAPDFVGGAELTAATDVVDRLPTSVGKRRKLSVVREESSAAAAPRESDDRSDDDYESEGDDDDRRRMQLHRVRKLVRNTPWLSEMSHSSLAERVHSQMSEGARNMYS